jgi:hypothetical protein
VTKLEPAAEKGVPPAVAAGGAAEPEPEPAAEPAADTADAAGAAPEPEPTAAGWEAESYVVPAGFGDVDDVQFPPRVRILHISDTHMLHRQIEARFPLGLPAADILIHTGDWSENGTKEENADFDEWLASVAPRYKHVIVVAGNHEWRRLKQNTAAMVQAAKDPKKHIVSSLPSLRPGIDYVLGHEGVTLCGVNIYGCSWEPCASAGNPDEVGQSDGYQQVWSDACAAKGGALLSPTDMYERVPPNIDVLLTHGPRDGIFDQVENTQYSWGSSKALRDAVQEKRPGAHLFGHLHEQRGVWHRQSPAGVQWSGGCEYEIQPGSGNPIRTWPAPSTDYPGTLISCNAMKNHKSLEGVSEGRIAAGGRLIVATKVQGVSKPAPWAGGATSVWHFAPC